jgi:DNA replication protein DnaC
VYGEEHALLELEYLERGYGARERLEELNLPSEEFSKRLKVQLGYIKARIPLEFWEENVVMRVPRAVGKEIQTYVENASQVRRFGLGLTLFGAGAGYKSQSLYVAGRVLVDRNFSCFFVTYDELIYLLKESWNDLLLKRELLERLEFDFLFLIEVPESDDSPPSARQDLFGLMGLRQGRSLPTIFSVNTSISSLDNLLPKSAVGRLVLPFVRVNKPIFVENVGGTDTMYEDRWGLFDGSR